MKRNRERDLKISNIFANAKAGQDVTQLVADALAGDERTFWNGEPTACRKVFVRMAETTEFPKFWGQHLLGQEVPAVEVAYFKDEPPFYLYDADGIGWAKVTLGHGGPDWGHRSVPVTDKESVKPRAIALARQLAPESPSRESIYSLRLGGKE